MRRALAVLFLASLAACGGGRDPSTPREALDALRAVLLAGDGRAYLKLIDAESRSRSKAEVRERRALIARGEDAAAVFRGLPLTPDEVKRGDEADVAALFLPRRSPLFRDAQWIADAAIDAERQESEDATAIDLKGGDGGMRRLWFVREGGAWRFDNLRTRGEWPN